MTLCIAGALLCGPQGVRHSMAFKTENIPAKRPHTVPPLGIRWVNCQGALTLSENAAMGAEGYYASFSSTNCSN